MTSSLRSVSGRGRGNGTGKGLAVRQAGKQFPLVEAQVAFGLVGRTLGGRPLELGAAQDGMMVWDFNWPLQSWLCGHQTVGGQDQSGWGV